jgi:hypothetical protein
MAMKPFNSVGGISIGTDSRQALSADGSADFASLEVGNTSNLNGQVFVNSTLVVSNAATFNETVLVNGTLTANAGLDILADLTVGNSLSVTGPTYVGDLSATGNIVLNSVTITEQQMLPGGVLFEILGTDQALQMHHIDTSVSGKFSMVFTDNTGVGLVTDAGEITVGTDGNVTVTDSMSIGGDLSVAGTTTLGDVGNVSISGGASGQYLQTNGSGNLSWVSLDTDTLANGSSNVSIDSSGGDVTIAVDGEANVAVFSSNGLTVEGSVGASSFSGDGSALGNITGANVVGDVGGANHANVADVAYSVSGANVSGNVAGASMAYALSAAVANVAITGGSNGQVLTTNGSGALSWSNQSGIKYTREWHIDPTVGNDTTGDGSYNRPFATIAKVKAVIGVQTGQTIHLHNSIYTENVTWTVGNTDFVYAGDGGMAYCTGTWTFSHSTPGSVRVLNLQFEGVVTVSGTGSVYFGSCNLVGGLNKTGNGYIEMRNDTMVSDTTSFVSITGSGIVNMLGGAANSITVNNAGAQFIARDATLAIITVTSGLALVDTSFIYSATATSNAVTSTPAGIFYAYNSHFVTSAGALSRLSLAGAWSINDTQYDKANSTLTGTNLGTVSYSDAINTQGLANVASLQVRGTSTLGPVGNVSISGGTSGQYLQTNGSGALSFTTVSLSNINNGTSNVSVAASGNITIASNGQGNIATFSSNGTFATTTINDDVIVTGNLTVQGNTVSVNVAELNVEDPIITEGRAPNNTPLSAVDGKDRGLFSYYYDGAEKGAFIGIMTTGAHAGEYVVSTDAVVSNNVVTTSSYGNIVVGNVIGNLANGSTAVGIAGSDADITMSVDGTANVVVVDTAGITVNGKVTVGGTGIGGATLTTTSTDTVALVSIQDAAGLAVEVLIKGADAAGTKFEVATLLLISDGAGTVDYTIFGVTSTSTSTGILSATKNGAVVELNVTPSSSNSTVWTAQYRTI